MTRLEPDYPLEPLAAIARYASGRNTREASSNMDIPTPEEIIVDDVTGYARVTPRTMSDLP